MRCLIISYKQVIYFFSIMTFKIELTEVLIISFLSRTELDPEVSLKHSKTRLAKIPVELIFCQLLLHTPRIPKVAKATVTKKKLSVETSFSISIYSVWTPITIDPVTP